MNDCRRIGRLIHLHRNGERTREEEQRVREHVAGCAACAALLRSVERAGEQIAAARNTRMEATPPPSLVARVAAEVEGAGRARRRAQAASRRTFRPAIAFVAVCMSVGLAFQQGRDAIDAARMERRLADRAGGISGGGGEFLDRLSDLPSVLAPRTGGARGTGFAGASAVPRFLIPGFGGDDLFRVYAKKYPALAAVNPYDGIDRREREALATEGRAFLEEFRSLIRKGE